MTIAYACHESFPSSNTNTQQIFWTLFEVAKLGVEVTLTVPSVALAARKDIRGAVAVHYGASEQQMPESFRILPRRAGPVDSVVGRGWFDWRLGRRLAGGSADLVWTRDPVTAMAAAQRQRPVVFETYRPDYAHAARFALWRAACLPRLAGVIVHSHPAEKAFARAGLPAARCLVAHNGFAPELMAPALSRTAARERLGLPLEGPLVVYAGHVGRAKGTTALLALAESARDTRFLILGAEPGPPHAKLPGAPSNVTVRARVELGDVAPYLYAADCLVVPPTGEPLRRFRQTVLPMKVFTYLAAGRPILAPRLPDIEEVLTDGVTARLVPPDDPASAAASLKALLADAPLQARLAANARALSAEYTWAARASRIVPFLAVRATAGSAAAC